MLAIIIVTLPLIFGSLMLGLDFSLWFLWQERIQSIANISAVAAARSVVKNGDPYAAATNAVVNNGLNAASAQIYWPPEYSPYNSSIYALRNEAVIEVIITYVPPIYFAALLFTAPKIIVKADAAVNRLNGQPAPCNVCTYPALPNCGNLCNAGLVQ